MKKGLLVILIFLAIFIVACGKVSNETTSSTSSKKVGNVRLSGAFPIVDTGKEELIVSSNKLAMTLFRLNLDGSMSIIAWGESVATPNTFLSTAYNSEGSILKKDGAGDVYLNKTDEPVEQWEYYLTYTPYDNATYLLNFYNPSNNIDHFIYIKGEEVSVNITAESEKFSTYNTLVSRIIMADEQKLIKTKSKLDSDSVKNVIGEDFIDIIGYNPVNLRIPSFNYKRPVYYPVSSNMVEYWLSEVVVKHGGNQKIYNDYIRTLPENIFPTSSVEYLLKKYSSRHNQSKSTTVKKDFKPFVPVKPGEESTGSSGSSSAPNSSNPSTAIVEPAKITESGRPTWKK